MATLCYKGRGGKFFLFRDCEGAVGFRQWAFFFFFLRRSLSRHSQLLSPFSTPLLYLFQPSGASVRVLFVLCVRISAVRPGPLRAL